MNTGSCLYFSIDKEEDVYTEVDFNWAIFSREYLEASQLHIDDPRFIGKAKLRFLTGSQYANCIRLIMNCEDAKIVARQLFGEIMNEIQHYTNDQKEESE
ncbi:MAG: hypothetical protein ACRCZG_03395 [Culicoidibacterales bacterium]